MTIYTLYSFSYLEPVCCSMSSSNGCFLTCIKVSQEADQVVWYSHLSVSCLKSVLTLCHNLNSRDFDHISPFHITKPASTDGWFSALTTSCWLWEASNFLWAGTCLSKTLDALIRHMSARRREININIHETVTSMNFPRVQWSESCQMCSSPRRDEE